MAALGSASPSEPSSPVGFSTQFFQAFPIPKINLDRFSLVALFALFPAMPEGTRFAISKHSVYPQKPWNYKIRGYLINVQGLWRNVRGDSRKDIKEFSIPIETALSWYGQNPHFLRLLPYTMEGLQAYQKMYEEDEDITQEDLEFVSIPGELKDKINLFLKNQKKEKINLEAIQEEIKNSWSELEIQTIVDKIILVIEEKKKGCAFQGILGESLRLLEEKQKKMEPLLIQEQERLKV